MMHRWWRPLTSMIRGGAPLALCAAWAPMGCSLALDASREQCATDLDCSDRGGAFETGVCIDSLCQENPKWGCVNGTERLTAQKAMQASLTVFDIVGGRGMPGVAIELCNRPDFDCENPFNTTTTDAQGQAQVSLTDNFTGYLSMTKEGVIDPTLVFPALPLFAGESLGTVPLTPPGGAAFLSNQLGVDLVPGRGTVLMQVLDCQNQPGFGAVLSFQGDMSDARPYYGFNGLPSSTAASVDASAQAGVLNAVPGFLGIQGNMADLPVSQTSVIVHADTITVTQLKPGFGSLDPF